MGNTPSCVNIIDSPPDLLDVQHLPLAAPQHPLPYPNRLLACLQYTKPPITPTDQVRLLALVVASATTVSDVPK